MESTLRLTKNDQAIVQESVRQTLGTEDWQNIEAAIFIGANTYLYKRRDPKRPHVFQYKCLSPETLAAAFQIEQIDTGWLPPGLVRCGSNTRGNWAVFFVPPQCCSIAVEATRLKVPLPGLVLLGCESQYWLWAICESQFDPQSKAHYAPLPNVHNTGKICWGSNKPPSLANQSIAQTWKLFIESPFNDHLVQGKSQKYPQTIVQQLRSLSKRNCKTYPDRDLVAVPENYRGISIGELIETKIT